MLIGENIIYSLLHAVSLESFLLIISLIALYLLFMKLKTSISDILDISDLSIEEFGYNPHKTIEAIIGTKSTTIISFLPYEIEEVIWDKKKCKIIFDTYKKTIRIVPKVRTGATIELKIITNTDKQQNLLLSVNNEEKGKNILIRNSAKNKKPIKTTLISAKPGNSISAYIDKRK